MVFRRFVFQDIMAFEESSDFVGYSKGNNNAEVLVSGDSKTQILINGNGKIKKNGSVSKDLDDNKVTVSNYIVTKIETD